ncbi:hypothetical protein [Methylobacterium sp. WSM2598]|uniref:hypothetical protein n=1 Tax=Methylobacterium sp. WSM2598 TaxID=398261 RepID=UPI0012F669C1|nr:hypothetical protein [Methylobacterium sp. WSM2598]
MLGAAGGPPSSGSGGSFGAARAGAALSVACEAPRRERLAGTGLDPEKAVLARGRVTSGGPQESPRPDPLTLDTLRPGLGEPEAAPEPDPPRRRHAASIRRSCSASATP